MNHAALSFGVLGWMLVYGWAYSKLYLGACSAATGVRWYHGSKDIILRCFETKDREKLQSTDVWTLFHLLPFPG